LVVKLLSGWLVALSLSTSLLLSGKAAAQVAIMPLGDSISQGISSQCSYRRPLSQALIENACGVNFVGSRTTAGTGGAVNRPPIQACAPQNTNHQAVSGYRADQILNNPEYNFTNELNSKQPDIVLLHIGSNDIFQDQSVTSTVNDVDAIIDRVFLHRPTATVVVADVIPWSEESVNPLVFPPLVNPNRDMLAVSAQLSAALKTLVNNRASSGDAVALVEVKDGFDNDLMAFDGVHPNPVGEAHIANRMLTALYDLGVCNGTQTDVQPPITYISVPSQENEQLSESPTLSGTAVDEGGSGIQKVRIAIENAQGEWLNYASGTFSSTFDSSIVATLSNTTNSSTSWSIPTSLAPGDYRLFALALDNNNNQVEESFGNGQPGNNRKVWTMRGFEVVNNDAATPAITTPAVGATLSPNSATFTWVDNGTAVTEWWLYAGNAQSGSGQYLYDRGGSLPAATRSTVLTGLPGDSSIVYVTLWYKPVNSGWKSVITQYTAASTGGGPIISNPAAGSTLTSSAQTFTFADNGVPVDEYWLYLGSGVNQFDYYNSGSISGTSTQATGLPTNGETVYARLWYRETGGPWIYVDSTYTAATTGSPAMSSPANGSTIATTQTFNWSANGATVGEWWLYVGSKSGGADIYNSGSLGSATSDTVSGLPSGPVFVRLWFRATGGVWDSVRYTYTVQ